MFLRAFLPDWLLYILPIIVIAALGLLGGPIPRDIMRAGRSKRPGKLGVVLLGSVLFAFGVLLIPVYGAWGVILTALLGLAAWKRAYYAGPGAADPLWQRL